MKICAEDKDFQKYARAHDYGNDDPRCDPASPAWDAEYDNQSALVALNDGCYQVRYTFTAADGTVYRRGQFVTPEKVERLAREEVERGGWMIWEALF